MYHKNPTYWKNYVARLTLGFEDVPGLYNDGRGNFVTTIHNSYVREHPFNLKGGYGFFRSQFFPASLAQQNFFFETSCRNIIFFSTKTIIFKAQSANRIFFSAHFRDRIFFQSNLPTEIFPPKKTIAPCYIFVVTNFGRYRNRLFFKITIVNLYIYFSIYSFQRNKLI